MKDLELLKKAHKKSIHNKNIILQSKLCGCFYCKRTFKPEEIKEWVDDKSDTALCPYCDIDSVIGDASGYDVSDKQFLKDMHERWFK